MAERIQGLALHTAIPGRRRSLWYCRRDGDVPQDRDNPSCKRVAGIFRDAQQCAQCYGNIPLRVPLPDERNGALGVAVMFICERPGRVGPGQTGRVSFDNPDPSAETFKRLVEHTGIPRECIFITNAVLCYPGADDYRDRPPSTAQLRNCSPFLREQIRLLQPRLIVPCGNAARKALCLLHPESKTLRRFSLKRDIGSIIRDTVPWVYPVYHTSRRVQIAWRPFVEQSQDWATIPKLLRELELMG